jgi:hypothetical protein
MKYLKEQRTYLGIICDFKAEVSCVFKRLCLDA